MPYTLSFTVHVGAVDPGRAIETDVRGDLVGPARLELADHGPDRSTARLAWEVELRLPMLSAASLVARPLLVWAHDHVVTSGLDGFRRAVEHP